MTLTNPVFLWGMLGAIVPIAIHLWSKQEAMVVKIGSIKLLEKQESTKSRRLYLNEIPLLILRVLIIAVLSVIAAVPNFPISSQSEGNNFVILISPALANAIEDYLPTETLANTDIIHIFKSGLPYWEADKIYISDEPDYWQLIPEIEELQQDSILIISQQQLRKVKGKRPVSSKNITWLEAEKSDVNQSIIKASEFEERLNIWELSSSSMRSKVLQSTITYQDSNAIEFKKGDQLDSIRSKNQKQWIPIDKPNLYLVGVVVDKEFEAEIFYLTKALETIGEYLSMNIQVIQINDAVSDLNRLGLIIDLRDSIRNRSVHTKMITYEKDEFAELITESVKANHFFLTDRLNVENIINRGLVTHLINIIEPDTEAQKLLAISDVRSVNPDQLNPRSIKKGTLLTPKLINVSHYFWMVLIGLLGAERVISLFRKQ